MILGEAYLSVAVLFWEFTRSKREKSSFLWFKAKVYPCAVASVTSSQKQYYTAKLMRPDAKSWRCTAKEMSNKVGHNSRRPHYFWGYFISVLTRLLPHKTAIHIHLVRAVRRCYFLLGSVWQLPAPVSQGTRGKEHYRNTKLQQALLEKIPLNTPPPLFLVTLHTTSC